MGAFFLGVLSVIAGTLILLVIVSLCTWLAASIIRANSDTAAVMFITAFIGSIVGHYFFGAWGPGILEIYLLPAVIGAFGGMILGPIVWALFSA